MDKKDLISFSMEGLNEIDDILSELADKEKNDIYIKAMREGAKIVQKQLEANATISGVKAQIQASAKKGIVDVGIKVEKNLENGKTIQRAYIVRFLEFGTVVRTTRKGKNRGEMGTGKAFVAKTLDSTVNQVVELFQKEWATQVDKIIEQKNKRVKKKIENI